MTRAYVGINPCGCMTAAMVDDDTTTAKAIADFARRMQRTGRKVENVPMERVKEMLKNCPHGKRKATTSQKADG